MFSRCLIFFGIFFFLQQIQGGWIGNQVENFLSPILQPITEATEKLQTNLDEVETKRQELLVQKEQLREKINNIPKECRDEELLKDFAFFDKWDFDSCVNLTDDMKAASELAVQGGAFARNLSETVRAYGGNILSCANEEYDQIFPCYNTNLKALEYRMEEFKNDTVPFVHDSVAVARDMRQDFDRCVGIPLTLRVDRCPSVKAYLPSTTIGLRPGGYSWTYTVDDAAD